MVCHLFPFCRMFEPIRTHWVELDVAIAAQNIGENRGLSLFFMQT